jgi:ribosomal protein L11 methyltransferase
VTTIEISIPNITESQSDIFVALLAEEQYDSFWQEANCLKAYIAEDQFDTNILEQILQVHPYAIASIAYKNWNKDWESNYPPVPINKEVAIIAPFHEDFVNVKHNLVIIPKMSFGTGHHSTTHLMIEEISKLDCKGKSVLDYGCGTGVLGIYAAVLGAKNVLGVDIDDWCVENTLENIGLNHIETMEVRKADIFDLDETIYDIILANINYNILEKNMAHITKRLSKGGHLLLSGLLDSDLENMKKIAENNNVIYQQSRNRLNWIMLHFTN